MQFIIKGVNHKLSNNDWETQLETQAIPESLDNKPSYDFLSGIMLQDIVAKGKVVNTSAISFQAGEKGYKELPNNINLVVEKGTELVIRITAAGASAAGLKYNLRGTL